MAETPNIYFSIECIAFQTKIADKLLQVTVVVFLELQIALYNYFKHNSESSKDPGHHADRSDFRVSCSFPI